MTKRTVQKAPSYLYAGQKLIKICSTQNKIYGLLAGGVPDTVNTDMQDTGNLKGKYGEIVIGGMLNILALENENCFVFHSVAAPHNKPGETDHILLYKNKLILVETKTYSNFKSFKVSKEGELKGRKIGEKSTLRRLENNNLIEKVNDYQLFFPEYSIHAITAITRSDVYTSSENGKYKVASLSDILQNIYYHMERAEDISSDLNEESIHYLASQCLKRN